MAASIGKRKRQTDDNGSEDGSEDEQALRARFQKAFETKFKPLSPSEHPTQIEEPEPIEEDSESEGSEWDGLSDEDVLVQVVDHHIPRGEDQLNEKYERKSFMASICDHFYGYPTNTSQSPQNHHHPQQSLQLD